MHGGGKISMPPVVGVQIFSGTTQFKRIIAISFIIHGITHSTFMLLIYVSFNFIDKLHNKCNSHAFYQSFQSNYF